MSSSWKLINKFIEINNICRPPEPIPDDAVAFSQVGKEVKGKAHTYYQVLIDARDCPYIVSKFLFIN